jgi:hypothetical protein
MMRSVGAILIGAVVAVVPGAPVTAAQTMYSVLSDDPRYLFSTGSLYSIDLGTGIATKLGPIGLPAVVDLEVISGSLYAIGGEPGGSWTVWRLDSLPGTLLGSTSWARQSDWGGLAYDQSNGSLYFLEYSQDGLMPLTLDLATGLATPAAENMLQAFTGSAAFNSRGDLFYLSGNARLRRLDLKDFTTTSVGWVGPAMDDCYGAAMAFDADDVLWALTHSGDLFTIDTTTGTALLKLSVRSADGQVLQGWSGLAMVPEPGAGSALALACLLLRRRRGR